MQPVWQTPSAPFHQPPRLCACSASTPGTCGSPLWAQRECEIPDSKLLLRPGSEEPASNSTPGASPGPAGVHSCLFPPVLRGLLFPRRSSPALSSPIPHPQPPPSPRRPCDPETKLLWYGAMWSLSEFSMWLLSCKHQNSWGGLCLDCFLLGPWNLAKCLTHGEFSKNSCWLFGWTDGQMNGWMNENQCVLGRNGDVTAMPSFIELQISRAFLSLKYIRPSL